jgi:hypothetical protein
MFQEASNDRLIRCLFISHYCLTTVSSFAAECSELTKVTVGKCNANNHKQLLITRPAGIHGLDLSKYVKGSQSCSVEF